MTTEWAHLPNAAHIDRVLADVAARPDLWIASAHVAGGIADDGVEDVYREATARDAIWHTARSDAWETIRATGRSRAWSAAGDAASTAGRGRSWAPARGAVATLIAWDDCAELLALDPDAVRLLAASGHVPAVLLLPACIALKTT